MTVAAKPLLEIEALAVQVATRGGTVMPVRDVTLAVAAGETLGLVGESGSGKSMTMQAVMGLIDPPAAIAHGDIRWQGASLRDAPALAGRVRGRDISIIFQDAMTSLNPLMSAGSQITEVLRRHHGLRAAAAWARAESLLEQVGVDDAPRRMRALPHQLSGGLRQRVLIAMALAAEPALLIADEPTTALDVTVQAQIVDLLRRLRTELGLAMVLVTHDLGLVAQLCERVAVMYAGRIVEVAPAQALYAAPAHPYTAGLIRSTLRIDGPEQDGPLRAIPGVPPSPSQVMVGCAYAPRCPGADARCREQRPPLASMGARRVSACWHPLQPAVHAGEGRA